MHNIQRKILGKLLYAESLAYAQLRPEGVESNHFSYHLDQLIRAGLVQKLDRRYALTPTGLAFIDRLSQGKMVDRVQPHIVTAIDITDNDGHTLLFKRAFQPYIHRVGLPLGKIHYEESIAKAAARELTEKTGLTDIPLRHRGMAYIDARQGDVTISKVLYHIFQGKVAKALPAVCPDPKRGHCLWADVSSFKKEELMPGFLEIKQMLASDQELFFAEITAKL